MSFEGLRSRLNNSTNQPANRGNLGPQRDMWNQPIEPEPQQQNNNNNNNNNTNTNTNNNNNNGNGNNDGINDADIDSIWADVKKEGSQSNGNQPPNNQNNNNNNAPQLTPQEQMNKYLKDNGLDPVVITEQMKAQIEAGDMNGLLTELNTKIQLAHTKALSNTKVLIDNEVTKLRDEMRRDNQNYVEGGKSLEALQAALPAAKDPVLSPILQTVMQRFINKGANREEAIKMTKAFSTRFVKSFDPDFDPDVKPNRNRNNNFGGGAEGTNDGTADWLDVLSSKASR